MFACVVCCFWSDGRGWEQNCTFSHYKIINEILTTSTGEKTKGDKLCDNDTQALVCDWLLWSFSLKSSCATFTRPAKAHICWIDHSGVNCSCESPWLFFFLFNNCWLLDSECGDLQRFLSLHSIPEAETFPECVDAFRVGNGLPLSLLCTETNRILKTLTETLRWI